MNEAPVTEGTQESPEINAPATTPPKSGSGFSKLVQKIWDIEIRIFSPFIESFLPKPHYLPGETIQQVINMAEYRIRTPKILGVVGGLMLIPSVIAYILTTVSGMGAGEMIAAGLAILGLFFMAEGIWGWLIYNQWHFILTDKRIILVTPDPDRTGFADAIYLKRGKIQVLDTNFSHSPVWGLFQILTGSRDVMLSMGGYEFYETGAKVKGGLRFPDVIPEDIRRLEELIFGG